MIINLIKHLTSKNDYTSIGLDGCHSPNESGNYDIVVLYKDLTSYRRVAIHYTRLLGLPEGKMYRAAFRQSVNNPAYLLFTQDNERTNMTGVSAFNFNQHKLRAIFIKDEPYFCVVDLRNILCIPQNSRLIQGLVKGFVKSELLTDGGKQQSYFCSEKDLYKIILRSNSSLAEPFQDWVCGEVLPTLRKTGSYTLATQPSNPILDYDKVYTYELNNVFLPHTLHFRFDDRTTFAYLLDRDMFDCLGNGNYEGKGSFLPYFFKYSPDKAYDNFFDFADVLEIAHRKNTLKTNIFLYESRNILKWLQKLTGKKITPISRYVGTTLQRITA